MSEESSAENVMSKRQMKRKAKHEKWLADRPIRKQKNKERRKRKISQERDEGVSKVLRKQIKLMKDSPCQIRVAIDLSQDYLMTDNELSKSIKQVQNCYSLNRRAVSPLQLHLTSFNGAAKLRLQKVQPGYTNWDVHLQDKHYTEAFDKDSLVYLTSESPNVLDTLEESKVYIIGGIVDHNRYKGLCYNLAEEQKIQHAKLPIDKFLVMKTRKVLTIDHVFTILLRVAEGKSWKDAFLGVLPQRKAARLKEDDGVEDENGTEEVADENETEEVADSTEDVTRDIKAVEDVASEGNDKARDIANEKFSELAASS